MDARNELVGHATLAVLSLLGMALYSATYALVYASASAKTPPVAALEFWMTTLHLFSSAGCCVGQALSMSFFRLKTPVRHVAEAQTALFLGVACGVTTLGSACLGAPADHQGAECAVYFGSAALPRAAAAGAITWSWIMYVSSLGCQSWTGREGQAVSLGLRGISGLTAFAVMTLLPWILLDKLVRTCGDRWKILLCSDVKVSVSADMATSTVSANCTHIETALGLSCTIVGIALLLAWIGNAIQYKFAGRIMCFVAALLAAGGQLVVRALSTRALLCLP